MAPTLSTLDKFKENVSRFNTVLNSIVCAEYKEQPSKRQELHDMLNLAGTYIGYMDPKKLIESFIERSQKYWLRIYHRDKSFFQMELPSVFSQIESVSVVLQNVFNKLTPTIEDRIWMWITTLVKQAIKYLSEQPVSKRQHLINDDELTKFCQLYSVQT